MNNTRIALGVVSVAVAGCSGLSPLPHPSALKPVETPSHWAAPGPSGATPGRSARWWTAFDDARLDVLIDAACEDNIDVAVAHVQALQARRQSELGNPAWSTSFSLTTSSRLVAGGADTTTNGSVGLSYEVDLWGRLAAARSVDAWRLEAAESNRQVVQLTVIGAVASNYWQIGWLNQRIADNAADIEDARRIVRLVAARHAAGSVSSLDEVQAQQDLLGLQQVRSDLLQQRTEARNAYAILFDRPPQHAAPEPESLDGGAIPAIDAGLPADVLAQRPDVRAAEQAVRAAHADIDFRRRSLYPRLSLTGTLGLASAELRNLVHSPLRAMGATIGMVNIDPAGVRLLLGNAQSTEDQAVLAFRKTLYTAMAEVENVLSQRAQLAQEGVQLAQALSLARRAETLSEVRYRAGAIALQPTLEVKRSRRAAQVAVATNRRNQLGAAMLLYKALGGAGAQSGSVSNAA